MFNRTLPPPGHQRWGKRTEPTINCEDSETFAVLVRHGSKLPALHLTRCRGTDVQSQKAWFRKEPKPQSSLRSGEVIESAFADIGRLLIINVLVEAAGVELSRVLK
jgi:hypothetical protein